MKNNKFAVLSLILTIVLIISTFGIPFSTVLADTRDPYSYLVTEKLGSEWDAWNSNNSAVDGAGEKIRTEEYVNIVNDPTNSGRGGVLRIGHADYATSMGLRVTQSTTVQYSHKFESLFYLDGALDSSSYILVKNSDAWGSGGQNRVDIAGIPTEKWVEMNTENALAGTDGLSGTGFCHISNGYVTIIFNLVLDAGEYFYIDDLSIAAGNANTYKKNIDTSKGDTVIYSNSFVVDMANTAKTPITHIDEWDTWVSATSASSFTETVGTVTDGENKSIIFYNKDKAFTGSITQNVLGIENGTYTVSLDCRTGGYNSAVIALENYGGSKHQTAINAKADEMKTVTVENISVTNNRIDITIYANGNAGEYLIFDNVTLKKQGSDDNLVLNGDFESAYSATVEPVRKGSAPENWGSWLNGTSSETQFIANEGYNSNSSMAVVYDEDSSSNFNQTVKGLTGGKTYVVSAYVKFKGTGTASLYCKNWGSTYIISLPASDTWVKIFREITVADDKDRISLEFYCNAKSGDWFMVDNVKVFEKQNPAVNLIKNGDFETYTEDTQAPAIVVDYKTSIPNWKNWLDESVEGKFYNSVGYYTEGDNTRLAFYNKDSAFRGSINQDVPELINGTYTVSVKVRTGGYESAVLSVINYDKENTAAKKQKDIAVEGDTLTEVSFTVPVTNNGLTVTVYADGKAGQYLIIDDVTVTAENSSENLVLNGDFETKEPTTSVVPQKIADNADYWDTWANDEDVSGMFVADGGYNSATSYAIVNSTAQSNTITQTFSNLADGTYVFSAFVKSSGGQNDTGLVAKGFNAEAPKLQATAKITATNVWSRVLVEFKVTSGNAILSLWNNANTDNWIIIDNAKFYRKDDPQTQLMLNGDFTEYTSANSQTPAIAVDYVTAIPNWKSWIDESGEGKFYNSVGYYTEGDNTRLAFYNKDSAFRGSINQDVPELVNGNYIITVMARTTGYKSAVISAINFDKENPNAKIQKSIVIKDKELTKVSITVPVTDNSLTVTVYADGEAGQYLIVDDVTVALEGSTENLVLNGDFETKETEGTVPEKLADMADEWKVWANDDNTDGMFVARGGYSGSASFAMVNSIAHSNSLTQDFSNLADGTYVFSAFVKSSGGQNDTALVAKGFNAEAPKLQATAKITATNVWSRVLVEFTVTSGNVSLSFWNNANEGNWLLVDNAKLYRKDDPKTQLMLNGDFEEYSDRKDPAELNIDYKASIPNWRNWIDTKSEGEFENSVGYYTEDNNTRLAFFNKDSAFRGSINQDIPELANGTYTVTVKARTGGYKSAVISVMNYDKENAKAKLQKSIVTGEKLTEVSFTVPVTNNSLTVTVYADGLAGQYLIIDDVTVTAEGGTENLVLNGDFESKETKGAIPDKLADIAYNWKLWANDDNTDGMFVARGGYKSDSSFAMVNSIAHSNSLTQDFSNLADGTYVFSAFVKSSGGQNDTALVAKGFNAEAPKLQATAKITATNVWSRVLVEFTVTSGNVSLSFWNNANEGNWLLIDNAKLYRKDTPQVQLMLNGDFDDYASYATEFRLPPRAKRIGGNKNQAGSSSSQSTNGATSNNNTPSINQTHSPATSNNSLVAVGLIIGVWLSLFILFSLINKLRKVLSD